METMAKTSSIQNEGLELRRCSPSSINSQMSSFIKGLRKRLGSTSLVTYLLFVVFGTGSWVAINGVWAELPILLVTQPECFKLATSLTLILQVANVGPLVYSLTKAGWDRFIHYNGLYLEVAGVFVILVLGVVSSLLLGVFWNYTVVIDGQATSIVLYVLAFFLALVDCTSSVVFVPFMKHFPSQYLSALYIGEGLSGVLPSTVALIQGSVNNSLACVPGEQSQFSTSEFDVLFSPNVFFSLLAIVMVICGLAFIGILLAPSSRSELFKLRQEPVETEVEMDSVALPCYSNKETEVTVFDRNSEDKSPLLEDDENEEVANEESEAIDKVDEPVVYRSKAKLSTLHKFMYILWRQRTPLVCLTILSFLLNGALPSISSFAFGSYDNLTLHLAINLGLLMNPIAAFLFMIVPSSSKLLISTFTAVCCLLGTYILINCFSYGVLIPGTAGGILIIIVNAVMAGFGSYTKVSIAVVLHSDSVAPGVALVLNGICTQLGSLMGAVLFFNLVYFSDLF